MFLFQTLYSFNYVLLFFWSFLLSVVNPPCYGCAYCPTYNNTNSSAPRVWNIAFITFHSKKSETFPTQKEFIEHTTRLSIPYLINCAHSRHVMVISGKTDIRNGHWTIVRAESQKDKVKVVSQLKKSWCTKWNLVDTITSYQNWYSVYLPLLVLVPQLENYEVLWL